MSPSGRRSGCCARRFGATELPRAVAIGGVSPVGSQRSGRGVVDRLRSVPPTAGRIATKRPWCGRSVAIGGVSPVGSQRSGRGVVDRLRSVPPTAGRVRSGQVLDPDPTGALRLPLAPRLLAPAGRSDPRCGLLSRPTPGQAVAARATTAGTAGRRVAAPGAPAAPALGAAGRDVTRALTATTVCGPAVTAVAGPRPAAVIGPVLATCGLRALPAAAAATAASAGPARTGGLRWRRRPVALGRRSALALCLLRRGRLTLGGGGGSGAGSGAGPGRCGTGIRARLGWPWLLGGLVSRALCGGGACVPMTTIAVGVAVPAATLPLASPLGPAVGAAAPPLAVSACVLALLGLRPLVAFTGPSAAGDGPRGGRGGRGGGGGPATLAAVLVAIRAP